MVELEILPEPKLTYSLEEVARHFSIAVVTVYRKIAQGEIRAYKLGRRTVVLHEDFDAFLKAMPIVKRRIIG